jgi:hypothetical protein
MPKNTYFVGLFHGHVPVTWLNLGASWIAVNRQEGKT